MRGHGDRFLDVIVARLVRVGRLTPRMSQALERCSYNTYRNHLAAAMRRVGAESHSELFRIVALDLDANPLAGESELDWVE